MITTHPSDNSDSEDREISGMCRQNIILAHPINNTNCGVAPPPTKTTTRGRSGHDNEGGYLLVYAVGVVVLLSLLGSSAVLMIGTDSRSSANLLGAMQAYYLAEAGVEYALKSMEEGEDLIEDSSISIGNGTVTVDTAAGAEDDLTILTSTGTVSVYEKSIQVVVEWESHFEEKAIYTTGGVSNVNTLDEDGDQEPELLVENAPSLPDIDEAGLIAEAASQGHTQSASTFQPSDGYPNSSFYYSGSDPNVTHVHGNLKVKGGRTVYGIFIVEGYVQLKGSARVQGVIYLMNSETTTINGGGGPSESSITGAIYSHGDVGGTGSHVTVRLNETYVEALGIYAEGGEREYEVVSWIEL